MNLSPQDKAKVLEMVAASIAQELVLGAGGEMMDLVLIPLGVAEKLMGLDARTIKARIPVVVISPTKCRVKLSDVRNFIAAKTKKPKPERNVA